MIFPPPSLKPEPTINHDGSEFIIGASCKLTLGVSSWSGKIRKSWGILSTGKRRRVVRVRLLQQKENVERSQKRCVNLQKDVECASAAGERKELFEVGEVETERVVPVSNKTVRTSFPIIKEVSPG